MAIEQGDNETATGAGDGNGNSSRYAFLQGRAKAFLMANDGASHEDALIRHVFGSGGPPALWRPLLRQMLGQAGALAGDTGAPFGTFELRPDGYWCLPGFAPPTAETPLLTGIPYVVLDVETTGLKPTRQRVIEIAAVRLCDGREAGLFSTLLQPDRRLPAYITELTKITQAMLEEAPRFAAIVDDLLRFLGDDPIVGHNVGFDIAFLNAELRRVHRPALLNPRLDTLPLAVNLLPTLRRPGLDNVARALDLSAPERHRAEADTRLTAAVLAKLLPLAHARGIHSLSDLQRIAGSGASDQRGDRPSDPPRQTYGLGSDGLREAVGRGRAVLDKAWLEGIPHHPGCYIMRDAHDAVIYVGKAKDLRDRVGSYYSQPLGYTRKLDGLLEAIRAIETVTTGSEMEALLLEAQLIRRYTPRYNTVGRNFEHYPYIKLDLADTWPRVFATRRRRDDGARYFGPFRNTRAVRQTIELLTEIVPLRTCRPQVRTPDRRWAPCLRLSLGKCLGPCVGQTTPDEYGVLVADVTRFLEGDASGITARLWHQLETAVGRLDFERAAALRNALRHVNNIALEGAVISGAVSTDDLILALPSAAPNAVEALLITRGRLWAQLRLDRTDDPAMVATRLRTSWERARAAVLPPVDHESVDEINLIARWLHRYHGQLTTLAMPDTDTPSGWYALAHALLTCDPTVAVLDAAEGAAEHEDSADGDEAGELAADQDIGIVEDDEIRYVPAADSV